MRKRGTRDIGVQEAANTKYQWPEVPKYSPSILRQTAHWLDVGLGWLILWQESIASGIDFRGILKNDLLHLENS